MGGQLRWDDAIVRTVLTNGHVPRAPEFFSSFFEGPFQLAVVKWIFKTNYLITFAKINCNGNLVNTFWRGPRSAGGAQGPSAGKDATSGQITQQEVVDPYKREAWRAEARARMAESRGGVPDRRPGAFEH